MEHKKTDQFLQQHMMLNLGALHLQGDHVGAFGQFSGVGLAYSTPSPLLHQEKIVKGSKKKRIRDKNKISSAGHDLIHSRQRT